MNLRNQYKLFYIVSGIFGWIWIGGGIAALVFAALAFFGDSSWWNVLYAIIVSGVAKWLTRGFFDHQKRVVFEADMMSKGMSPTEARQSWIEASLGRASPTDAIVPSSNIREAEKNK